MSSSDEEKIFSRNFRNISNLFEIDKEDGLKAEEQFQKVEELRQAEIANQIAGVKHKSGMEALIHLSKQIIVLFVVCFFIGIILLSLLAGVGVSLPFINQESSGWEELEKLFTIIVRAVPTIIFVIIGYLFKDIAPFMNIVTKK